MDADDVTEIIDNHQYTHTEARRRVRAYMLTAEAMPGQINDQPEPEGALATELGETIRHMVGQIMEREHRLTDRERNFTETLMARALGTVSWSDVGHFYYHAVRELAAYDQARAAGGPLAVPADPGIYLHQERG